MDSADRALRYLTTVLSRDERVQWIGRPVAPFAWTPVVPGQIESRWGRRIGLVASCVMSGIVVVIGLVFVGALVEIVSSGKATLLGYVFVIPFAAICLGILALGVAGACAPLALVFMASHTTYVLTDRAAYIVNLWRYPSNHRVPYLGLTEVHAERVVASGVGDVVLEREVHDLSGGDSSPSIALFDRGFIAVPDARDVAVRVNELSAQESSAASAAFESP